MRRLGIAGACVMLMACGPRVLLVDMEMDEGTESGEPPRTDPPRPPSPPSPPSPPPGTTGVPPNPTTATATWTTGSTGGSEDSASTGWSTRWGTSSTGTGPCTLDDECIDDDDCAGGGVCIACVCVGGDDECPDYGEGEWGDCLDEGEAACVRDDALCVADAGAAMYGACASPCDDVCDCPWPPIGFEEQLGCEAFLADPTQYCYISCEGGAECPAGWTCVADFICMI